MSKVTPIFDSGRKQIGRMIEDNFKIDAFNLKGNFLGRYTKRTDTTTDARNAFFSKGNRVMSLI